MSNKKTSTKEPTAEQLLEGKQKLWDIIHRCGEVDGAPEDLQRAVFSRMEKDDLLIGLLGTGQEKKATMRFTELTLKQVPDTPIAILEDGDKKETFTERDFFGLIFQAPDSADAAEKLQFWLGAMIEEAGRLEATKENPIAAKSLEAMSQLYEAISKSLEDGGSQEALDKFLKEQAAFMTVPRPAGIEELLRIYSNRKEENGLRIRENGIRISFSGRLGIDEQRINDMIMLSFSNNNPYKATKNLNTIVELPLNEVMDVLGRPQTDANKKKFRQQLRKEILPTIAHQHIELVKPDGSALRVEVGGGSWAVDARRNKIMMRISPEFATFINTGALSQYSSKTLRLGTQKKPLPFYLARKLQDHYFMDGNRKRKDKEGNPHPTNDIIGVRTLLTFCEDMLESYEYIQETDRGHWIRRIRTPLEEALNQIQEAGLFRWEYCKAGMKPATPQEIRTTDFNKWSQLYITVMLIPDEPNQTKRLENKQRRLEAAAEKKALKDAETIVKADKIERRKARQARKKSNQAAET